MSEIDLIRQIEDLKRRLAIQETRETPYQEDWIAVAFENSWVNFNAASHEAAAYFKDSFGIVHLKGLIKSGTMTLTAFTLPAGYRPPLWQHFAVPSNNAFGTVEIKADGTVVPFIGSNVWVSLAGITFRAA